MKAYKLKFHSSFHIDLGTVVDGPSDTFIHSDTLYSSIISAARKFYGDNIATDFIKNGSIILSSAFPYYKKEYFIPKPLNFFPEITQYELIKEFKKIKFISLEHFNHILNGLDYSNSEFFSDKKTAKKFILNNCWRTIKNSDDEVIFLTNEVPHIVMDRITNQTQIFYKSEVYFGKDAGLYFLAEVKEELQSKFETILRFLGDEGIGADRTTGKGLFEIEIILDFPLPTLTESNYYLLLSLYSPTKDEFENINPKESFYDFKIRGGWISNTTLNRKSLRMFVEGSVLSLKNKQRPIGMIHKTLEAKHYKDNIKYDVFRSGQAIFLPFISGGINNDN